MRKPFKLPAILVNDTGTRHVVVYGFRVPSGNMEYKTICGKNIRNTSMKPDVTCTDCWYTLADLWNDFQVGA